MKPKFKIGDRVFVKYPEERIKGTVVEIKNFITKRQMHTVYSVYHKLDNGYTVKIWFHSNRLQLIENALQKLKKRLNVVQKQRRVNETQTK